MTKNQTILKNKTIKVGIMQPYFMPYIGYISLLKHCEIFILFDTVQFIRHGWIERNRMLKQNNNWLYIKVPLIKVNSQKTLIKECLIDNQQDWKLKILHQIKHYKNIAPNYNQVEKILMEIFEKDYDNIVSLNKASLEAISTYLGFKKKLQILSEMELNIIKPKAPDEWALNICKELNLPKIHYVNLIGGLNFFNRDKYTKENIEISFHKMNMHCYNQQRDYFESGLSILDLLMFNSVEEINKMLDDYELV